MTNTIDAKQLELIQAIAQVQASIVAIPKSEMASIGGKLWYKYASLSSVLIALHETLQANKLVVLFDISYHDQQQHLITTLVHTTSGASRVSTVNLDNILDRIKDSRTDNTKESRIKTPNILHELGSILTYLKRYLLLGMLGIATEDDDAEIFTPKDVSAKQITITPEDQRQKLVQLAKLCNDQGINSQEFAKAFNISRNNMDSVENAIQQFDKLSIQYKDQYENAQSAT